jgi:hypothetical protein
MKEIMETLGYRGRELMYISDEDYCLEVNNITKTKTEIKTIRTCYLVNTDKHSTYNYGRS